MPSRRIRRERMKNIFTHLNSEGEECRIDGPHFIPPGLGMIGFFTCNTPEDIRNHTRCHPPFDHEHEDHFIEPDDPYAAPEEMDRRRALRQEREGTA